MKLKWMGHACFKLTTDAGTRIVIDPYDDNTGYGTLTTTADLLITRDRKSTRLNSSHPTTSRMPSSA